MIKGSDMVWQWGCGCDSCVEIFVQKMLFAQNSLLWTHAILHLSSLDFAEKGNISNMV